MTRLGEGGFVQEAPPSSRQVVRIASTLWSAVLVWRRPFDSPDALGTDLVYALSLSDADQRPSRRLIGFLAVAGFAACSPSPCMI